MINNHFSREELISIIETDYLQYGEASMLARIALAAMDSDPVADVVAWSSPNEERKCDIRWRRHDVKPGPLYRHAQPAPASEPVFFIEVEGDDWINAGRIPGSTFDFNNLPDGINYLYAAPQPLTDAEREELQERRKADSEPVAYISKSDFDAGYPHILARRDFNKACTMAVYSAQPAPVVQDERSAFNAWNNEENLPIAGVCAKKAAWLAWQARASLCGNSVMDVPPERPADSSNGDDVEAWFDEGWNACRAAMLAAAPQSAPVVPENCVTAEHRRVIEMLLNVCGAAFELADDSCQQDVDGEDCHVVPDDSFQKLSDALDEIENTLPTEDIDRPSAFLAWSAMPRAALESILQAGNPPVIPDGYVMVPKEPTESMVIAGFESEPDEFFSESGVWEAFQKMSGCEQAAFRARRCWAAMLAATPQSPSSEPATVPGKWIPVSEQMPEDGQHIIIFCDGAFVLFAQCRDGEFFDIVRDREEFFETTSRCVTHWMPLPNPPKEVK